MYKNFFVSKLLTHSITAYPYPNDQVRSDTVLQPEQDVACCIDSQTKPEIERMDTLNEILRMLFRRNYFAPIKNPEKILDIGTGHGTWAIELGAYDISSIIT